MRLRWTGTCIAVLTIAALALAVRGAAADAPAGRYTIANGTVLDTKTQLTWQQTIPAASYAWADATTYCTGLSLNGGGGWRLPSLGEFQTIVDDGQQTPAIDGTAFPATPSAEFWSSSPVTDRSGEAWSVNFIFGHTSNWAVANPYRVRCVR